MYHPGKIADPWKQVGNSIQKEEGAIAKRYRLHPDIPAAMQDESAKTGKRFG